MTQKPRSFLSLDLPVNPLPVVSRVSTVAKCDEWSDRGLRSSLRTPGLGARLGSSQKIARFPRARIVKPAVYMLRARLLLGLLTLAAQMVVGASARAEITARVDVPEKPRHAAPWCAPETEALPGDVCFLDGGVGARRTLVIFLHGAIAKNTTWQHNHQRGLLGLAKGNHVDVIFPRAPLSEKGYVWQGPLVTEPAAEENLIAGWMRAKRLLEQRAGRAYDDVFVMGFSSGGYFASSLAMRGRLDVDGYAVLAGGNSAPPPRTPVHRWAPVFVGVCANDPTSANDSRAFAGALDLAGIPRVVSEQPVGHGMSHIHFAYALSYLRAQTKLRSDIRT
jgi:predicted esterase